MSLSRQYAQWTPLLFPGMAMTDEVVVGERRICEQPNARERKLSDAE